MINTCSVDNFLTLINLHLSQIQEVLTSREIPINDNMKNILTCIGSLKFNSLRFWIARKMAIKCENDQLNFGSENNIVQALVKAGLSTQEYHCTFQCPHCSKHFNTKTRINYFTTLIENLQTILNSKVEPKFCKICRWKDTHFKNVSKQFHQLSPLLIIEAGNLQIDANMIDNVINMDHGNKMLTFKHIGYTLIYGNHFTLKTFVNQDLVSYDGMRNPKIQINEDSKFPDVRKVNFIAYILLP